MIKYLEIVVPIYNEEACLDELVARIVKLKEKMGDVILGIIFVNDGSSDKSRALLSAYAEKYKFFKILNFSRNFGHQMAVTAGLDYAEADYVAIIDGDLQDPPELIEDMYKKALEGFDIVYGQRLTRKGDSLFKRVSAKIFYLLINRMCDIEIPVDTGDFRLISNDVLKILKGMREKHRYIRGMVPWSGFSSAPLLYHRDERFAGETKYPLKKMIKFAKDAVFSFSSTPLKIANFVGYFVVFVGVLGGLLMLYFRLMTSWSVPGITAVILAIIIMSGIQIIMLGIIGEYIGRIFEESKGRPLYVVKDTKNINLK